MGTELKPCPFCGKSNSLQVCEVDRLIVSGSDEHEEPVYAVSCCYCGGNGPWALSKEAAADSWQHMPQGKSTCSFPVVEDEEEIERRSKLGPGTFTTCDVPLCRKCTACGFQIQPVAELPEWLKHCPNCGTEVEENR